MKEELKAKIKQDLEKGLSRKYIAKKYGYSKAYIDNLANGSDYPDRQKESILERLDAHIETNRNAGAGLRVDLKDSKGRWFGSIIDDEGLVFWSPANLTADNLKDIAKLMKLIEKEVRA